MCSDNSATRICGKDVALYRSRLSVMTVRQAKKMRFHFCDGIKAKLLFTMVVLGITPSDLTTAFSSKSISSPTIAVLEQKHGKESVRNGHNDGDVEEEVEACLNLLLKFCKLDFQYERLVQTALRGQVRDMALYLLAKVEKSGFLRLNGGETGEQRGWEWTVRPVGGGVFESEETVGAWLEREKTLSIGSQLRATGDTLTASVTRPGAGPGSLASSSSPSNETVRRQNHMTTDDDHQRSRPAGPTLHAPQTPERQGIKPSSRTTPSLPPLSPPVVSPRASPAKDRLFLPLLPSTPTDKARAESDLEYLINLVSPTTSPRPPPDTPTRFRTPSSGSLFSFSGTGTLVAAPALLKSPSSVKAGSMEKGLIGEDQTPDMAHMAEVDYFRGNARTPSSQVTAVHSPTTMIAGAGGANGDSRSGFKSSRAVDSLYSMPWLVGHGEKRWSSEKTAKTQEGAVSPVPSRKGTITSPVFQDEEARGTFLFFNQPDPQMPLVLPGPNPSPTTSSRTIPSLTHSLRIQVPSFTKSSTPSSKILLPSDFATPSDSGLTSSPVLIPQHQRPAPEAVTSSCWLTAHINTPPRLHHARAQLDEDIARSRAYLASLLDTARREEAALRALERRRDAVAEHFKLLDRDGH